MSDLRPNHVSDYENENSSKYAAGGVVAALAIGIGAFAFATGAFDSEPESVVADSRLPVTAPPPSEVTAPLPPPAIIAPTSVAVEPVAPIDRATRQEAPRLAAPVQRERVTTPANVAPIAPAIAPSIAPPQPPAAEITPTPAPEEPAATPQAMPEQAEPDLQE